ncbi:MAG TPA: SRPBCC domain-containing protein, partial [Bacteroidia bacterium]|nr:SRPBCC domain-containing protein [Bacteroidia bacterium]
NSNNSKMGKKNFHKAFKVKASAQEVVKRISEVNLWWAKDFRGKAKKVKDRFSVHFGSTYVKFQVSELIPDEKVVWKVTDCNLHWIHDKKEWRGTDVVFEISEGKSSTKVDFTHAGLFPGMECYKDCKAGWTEHLKIGLADLIDKGKGAPV